MPRLLRRPRSTRPLAVGSLFAGIGGFDLAAEFAGLRTAWACEINPDAQSVLRSRFPEVPLYTDVKETTLDPQAEEAAEAVDILCGGFPCQDLSTAGRRAGLAGERSGLFYEFARLIEEGRPTWVVIENVPGLLSSNRGRDMGVVLGTLGELGYGFAYRVLDAQYFGVAQRRRRVLIVGCLGDAVRAGAVLLEPEGSVGDPPTRRAAGASTAPDPESRLAGGGAVAFDWQAGGGGNDTSWRGGPRSWTVKQGDYAGALSTTKVQAVAAPQAPSGLVADGGVVTAVTGGLGSGGPDAAHAQARRLIPVEVSNSTGRGWWNGPDEHAGTLEARGWKDAHSVVAYQCHGSNVGKMGTLRAGNGHLTGGVPFVTTPTAYSIYPESGQGADLVVREMKEGPTPTLTANQGMYIGDRGTFVATVLETGAETLGVHRYDAIRADAAQARSREVLRALRDADGEEATARWLLGVAAALQAAQVLRSDMHGRSLRRSTEPFDGLGDDALPRPKVDSAGSMYGVRVSSGLGCSSPRRESHEQRSGELGEIVSLLSHEGAQRQGCLLGLREATEGSRSLRQALSALEEVGRSADGQGQPTHRSPTASRVEGGGGVSMAVRRLTPV